MLMCKHDVFQDIHQKTKREGFPIRPACKIHPNRQNHSYRDHRTSGTLRRVCRERGSFIAGETLPDDGSELRGGGL
mgnify:CR=1 FL=1